MEIESRYSTLVTMEALFFGLLCPFLGRGGQDHFSKSKK
jgi:hypothetical protein